MLSSQTERKKKRLNKLDPDQHLSKRVSSLRMTVPNKFQIKLGVKEDHVVGLYGGDVKFPSEKDGICV